MKKLFVVLAAAAMFVACGPKEAVKVTVEDLATTAVKYVGQEVEFTGSAAVCPQSGDFYVLGATPEAMVKVLPAKDAAFTGVEAKEVTVKGTVTEVEVEGAKTYVVQATSYQVGGDAKVACPVAKDEKACCAGDSTKCDSTKCASKCAGDSVKCAEKHAEAKK